MAQGDGQTRGRGIFFRGWRSIREAGARRLVLTGLLLVMALLLARFSWSYPAFSGAERTTPITGQAEQALYDVRSFIFAQQVPQDERILLIVYNDQTLINARKRSPLDRGLLAKTLENIDALGAKAIGIDILFDQPQDEDEELIETLRAMKTPVFVAYAETGVNSFDIRYEQQQYLEQFLKRLEGSNAHPASIALDDAFGVTRRWPPSYAHLPPVLGRAMLAEAGQTAKTLPGYEGAIRYRRPAMDAESETTPIYASFPIDNFADPELAAAFGSIVEGRYVLIGGDIVDYDRVATPITEVTGEMRPPGIAVHAEMIAQMLDGQRLPQVPSAMLWLAAVLIVGCSALTGLVEIRSLRIYPLLAAQFAAVAGLPFLLHWRGIDTLGLPAAGWILGWALAFAAVTSAARASGAVQRRFAQGALGKYLPREMAEEIIENPELLSLHGEKKELFVLFSDLEGFTKMSHALPPETVARLVNQYLDTLSQVVLDHGGVIDKFVGDAVVAFWGAPIARADDGERAARAGYAVWQAGEEFRRSVEPDIPPIGKTRVGLHWGEAVVGNFGGASRIQYTALGDSMNTAARLEAANKALDSSVMASREFAERSGLDWWRPMGRVVLRGRSKPVDLFEPAPDFPPEDRAALDRGIALIATDHEAALAAIAAVVERHPQDAALVNLLERTRKLETGDVYTLG
ncbi:MAG TPA: adenylate/guanylate cyclase domain-containing protein [Croceibacterium sp.]|nr:adenylate/guanylate cyclase domain-containing protein [Croceibacterium sp.]